MKIVLFAFLIGIITTSTSPTVVPVWFNYDYSFQKDYSLHYSEYYFRAKVEPQRKMDIELTMYENEFQSNYFTIYVLDYGFDPTDEQITNRQGTSIQRYLTSSIYAHGKYRVIYFAYTSEYYTTPYNYLGIIVSYEQTSTWQTFSYLNFRVDVTKYYFSNIIDLDYNTNYSFDPSIFFDYNIPYQYQIFTRIPVHPNAKMNIQLETKVNYDKTNAFKVDVCQYNNKPVESQVYYGTDAIKCTVGLPNESQEDYKYIYPFKNELEEANWLSIRIINQIADRKLSYLNMNIFTNWLPIVNISFNYDYDLQKNYSSNYSEYFFRAIISPQQDMDIEIKMTKNEFKEDYFSVLILDYNQEPTDEQIYHKTGYANNNTPEYSFYNQGDYKILSFHYKSINNYLGIIISTKKAWVQFSYLNFKIDVSKYKYSNIIDLNYNKNYTLDTNIFSDKIIPKGYQIYLRIPVYPNYKINIQLETKENYDKTNAFKVDVCQYNNKPVESQVYYGTDAIKCTNSLSNESQEDYKYIYPFKNELEEANWLSIRIINLINDKDLTYLNMDIFTNWLPIVNISFNYDYNLHKSYSSNYSEYFFRVQVLPEQEMDIEIKMDNNEYKDNYFSVMILDYNLTPTDDEIYYKTGYIRETNLIALTSVQEKYHVLSFSHKSIDKYLGIIVSTTKAWEEFSYLNFRVDLSKYKYSNIKEIGYDTSYSVDTSIFKDNIIPYQYQIYLSIQIQQNDKMEIQLETKEAYNKNNAFKVGVCQYKNKPTESQVYYSLGSEKCEENLENESEESNKYIYPFTTKLEVNWLLIDITNQISGKNLTSLNINIYSKNGMTVAILCVVIIVPILAVAAIIIVFFLLRRRARAGKNDSVNAELTNELNTI